MIPTLKPLGDSALLIEFQNRIDPAVSDQVLAFQGALAAANFEGVIELVPSYRTLVVHYDPLRLDYETLSSRVRRLAGKTATEAPKARRWRVPVWYGGPDALDLDDVARKQGLTRDEVIQIHASTVYRVYLVGFAPGWTFLGGLDERLHVPRLDSPRAEVPAGAISIAGQQGLICGPSMPSGWNLIGRTPERTWAPEREPPFFIEPGDEVEFRRIDGDEFAELEQLAEAGEPVSVLVDAESAESRLEAAPTFLSQPVGTAPASMSERLPRRRHKEPARFRLEATPTSLLQPVAASLVLGSDCPHGTSKTAVIPEFRELRSNERNIRDPHAKRDGGSIRPEPGI